MGHDKKLIAKKADARWYRVTPCIFREVKEDERD
jgi:hypothetical protein